jgi:hypothetical protein
MLRPQPTRIELKHDDMKELQALKQRQKVDAKAAAAAAAAAAAPAASATSAAARAAAGAHTPDVRAARIGLVGGAAGGT